MKQINIIILGILVLFLSTNTANSQEAEESLKITGSLLSDQRFLLNEPNEWAWNENRLTLKFDKKVTGNSKFYSEVWLRNIGLPTVNSSADLYNKGIIDPYNLEVREAYVQIFGFLTKFGDMTECLSACTTHLRP